MRRKIIARLLVFCMIVSMLAVPAMASTTLSAVPWSSNAYTLTEDTTLSTYSISSGAYTINAGTYKLTASSVSVASGATLTVKGGSSSSTELYTATGGVRLSNNVYYTNDSAYSISGSVTLTSTSGTFKYLTKLGTPSVLSGVTNYTTTSSASGGYTTYSLTYSGGSSGSPSTPSTTPSDSTEVATKTTVSGTTATVTVDSKAVTSAVTAAASSADKTVTIDASKAGANVTTATVQTSVLSTVSDASSVSLTIAMPAGEVTLSDAALTAIVAEAGTDVSVTLDVSNSTASLAAAQQESLTGLATGAAIDVSVTSNGKEITSFGGGSVTLSVPFKAPAANRPAEKFAVYYVAPTGGLTRQSTSYVDGKLSFTTTHFSDYVAIFEPFADVTADKWYAQYALYVSDNSIMNGTDKGFEGDLNLNRAMMVTTLYRIKGASAGSAAAFSDVAAGQWFTDAVNWAAANGVASGVGNNLFAPNADMTREQMAQFLYNYAKANGKDVSKTGDLSRFADASSVSGWAKEAMAWAVGEGYINGMDGKLNPQGTATRAQVATVLTRFAQA